MRLVLTVLGEAARFGAVTVNRAQAVALTATGAVVRDTLGGRELAVRAANVVNATGVWADRLRPEELHGEAELPVIRPSRGTHLILPAERLPVAAGVIAPAGEGRTIFALPWLGHTLVGTTDRDYDGDIEHVRPADRDVAYLLEAVNAFFHTALRPGDVAGAFAGVRPLIATGDPRKSVDISRRAELYETSSGLVTITGGKLTTWRRMAKLAVDRLVERAGREAPCRTHEIPLGLPVEPGELPRVEGVDATAYPRLAARYGHAAHEVLGLAAERRELAAPILPGASRPARGGGARRPPRTGADRRRRAAAPHAARADRRAGAVGAGRAGARAGRGRARRASWAGTPRASRPRLPPFRAEAAAEGTVIPAA